MAAFVTNLIITLQFSDSALLILFCSTVISPVSKELVVAHPDKFEWSSSPKAGAVFSAIGHNHVGIVTAVKDNT